MEHIITADFGVGKIKDLRAAYPNGDIRIFFPNCPGQHPGIIRNLLIVFHRFGGRGNRDPDKGKITVHRDLGIDQ